MEKHFPAIGHINEFCHKNVNGNYTRGRINQWDGIVPESLFKNFRTISQGRLKHFPKCFVEWKARPEEINSDTIKSLLRCIKMISIVLVSFAFSCSSSGLPSTKPARSAKWRWSLRTALFQAKHMLRVRMHCHLLRFPPLSSSNPTSSSPRSSVMSWNMQR